MTQLPVPSNIEALLERLGLEERQLRSQLTQLEDRMRRFEDLERPSYEAWIRLEFGPKLADLEKIYEQIHGQRLLAFRVNELVQTLCLKPQEALFVALSKKLEPGPGPDAHKNQNQTENENGRWNPDEIDARRRAKRQSKRSARREEAKKDKKVSNERSVASELMRKQIVALYHALAKRLHPDSPYFLKDMNASRALSLWLEVQSAYNSSNMERLLSISIWLEGDIPSEKETVVSLSDRFDRIRSMKRSCIRLEERLLKVHAHPAWEFGNLQKSEKRKVRRKVELELGEQIAQAQKLLDELSDFIDSIGVPRAPRAKNPKKGRA